MELATKTDIEELKALILQQKQAEAKTDLIAEYAHLDAVELAKLWGFSPRTIRDILKHVPHTRFGRTKKYSLKAINLYLETHTIAASSEMKAALKNLKHINNQ